MLKRTILILFLAILTIMAIIPAGCASKQSDKTNLSIGSLPRIFDLIAYVAQEEGLFEKQGVTVEIVPFRSTVEMDSALLAGELDGIIQDIFGVINIDADTVTVKAVGWSTMPRMFEVITSPGSDITSIEALNDKEVAVGTGTIMDYALDRLISAGGLNSEDIVKVNVPSMPLRLEVLSKGEVAAAILTSPLSDMAILNGGTVIADDTIQPFAGPGLVFSTNALKDKSEAIGRCIQAWQEAVELINADPEKYRSLLIEVAKIPEAISEQIQIPQFPALRLPADEEIEPIMSWMIDNGQMREYLDYEQVVDISYLK